MNSPTFDELHAIGVYAAERLPNGIWCVRIDCKSLFQTAAYRVPSLYAFSFRSIWGFWTGTRFLAGHFQAGRTVPTLRRMTGIVWVASPVEASLFLAGALSRKPDEG